MLDDAALNRMILTAYEAASDAGRWNALLEDLRRSFGATSAHLRATPDTPEPQTSWWVEDGIDAQVKSAYAQRWGAEDPWALHPRGHKVSTAGRCFIGSDILPWQELERTAFFSDFGRQAGLKGVMTALVEDGKGPTDTPPIRLALFRDGVLPEFDHAQLRAFQALQPALRRALNSFWAVRRLQVQAKEVEQTLDAMPYPVFVLRRDGLLEYRNAAARLHHTLGAVHISAGRIAGIAQIAGSRWLDLLNAAAAGLAPQPALWMPGPAGITTATLMLSRIGPESPFITHWPRAEILMMMQADNAERTRLARLEALASQYRLTAAEVRVLGHLAEGVAAEDIALAQGVRVSTIRTHIRHLLEKTYTRRLVDLVRVVG
ncbi:MAG: hypothetical protein H0W47_11710 [Polaromonas sp.]|nr:hypothetical protein [Polaromonas sp.]